MNGLKKMKGSVDAYELSGYLLLFVVIASELTHIITCLSDGRWGFLIAGAIMFPVAVVHGIGIWAGVW